MKLDHLAIAAETLDEGVAWAEERLGVTFLNGGKHERYGTHNKLLGLAGSIYLEVIAIDPDAKCSVPRWFNLDNFSGPPRLANWICEPSVLDPLLVHGMQRVPMQRGDLRWDMGVPPDGTLPMGGGFPTVLSWDTDVPPGELLPSTGVVLEELTVRHPLAETIAAELEGVLTDDRVRFRKDDEISLSAQFRHRDKVVTL
ncbi:VOC family protein [Octadecabacter sp. 1_MG-2023]|uniref:VOC family protein n=1 Tax=unclassified Octadecabacter TaxID=196158 RepID=UPI001C0A56CD|nr:MULTISPECIES: VOC family protein [unclassified Octadecabacter]MBU2993904.1 VOC family protein [Octadecabacter sp. B2R22]MDO6735250.1 VOC family protein [Octadecabacter sp. 1_MG-2023]